MSSFHQLANGLYQADLTIPDPGNAGTIDVDRTPSVVYLDCGSGETRTVAAPSKPGGMLTLSLKSGTCTVTVGATELAFTEVGQMSVLVSVPSTSGNVWCVIAGVGATGGAGTSGGNRVELGRIGVVGTDSGDDNAQAQTPVANATATTISNAQVRLGTAASGNTAFKLMSVNASNVTTDIASFTILAGQQTVDVSSLVGTALGANSVLSLKVTSGSDGKNLSLALTY